MSILTSTLTGARNTPFTIDDLKKCKNFKPCSVYAGETVFRCVKSSSSNPYRLLNLTIGKIAVTKRREHLEYDYQARDFRNKVTYDYQETITSAFDFNKIVKKYFYQK